MLLLPHGCLCCSYAAATLVLALPLLLRLLQVLVLLLWDCCTPESASSPSSSASSEALEASGSSPSPLRGARWFSCKHQQQRDITKHAADQCWNSHAKQGSQAVLAVVLSAAWLCVMMPQGR
jgi:hypothetical protein